MKFCGSCGKALREQSAFCGYCGKRLSGDGNISGASVGGAPGASRPTNGVGVTPVAVGGAPGASRPTNGVGVTPGARKNKPLLVAAILLPVVAIVAILAIILPFSGPGGSGGRNSGDGDGGAGGSSRQQSAEQFEKLLTEVNDAFGSALTALNERSGDVGIDEVIESLYSVAEGLVSDGVIRGLEYVETGFVFSYSDGTPGGVLLELPPYDEDADTRPSLTSSTNNAAGDASIERLVFTGSTPHGNTAAQPLPFTDSMPPAAFASTRSANVIGNNKILIGTNGGIQTNHRSEADWKNNDIATLKEKFDNFPLAKFETTFINGMTIQHYKTLNQYGAVFLHLPGAVELPDGIWIDTGARHVTMNIDEIRPLDDDRDEGRVGLFAMITPDDGYVPRGVEGGAIRAHKYDFKLVFLINARKFFGHYYEEAPNSFVHLGISNSMIDDELQRIFLGNGAGRVTGYSSLMPPSDFQSVLTPRRANYVIMKEMIDVFLRTDGGDKTAGNAHAAVDRARLITHSFSLSFYDRAWKLVPHDFHSSLIPFGASDLVLWELDVPTPDINFTLTNGLYYHSAHMPYLKWTITNYTESEVGKFEILYYRRGELFYRRNMYSENQFPMWIHPGESKEFFLDVHAITWELEPELTLGAFGAEADIWSGGKYGPEDWSVEANFVSVIGGRVVVHETFELKTFTHDNSNCRLNPICD